MKNFSRAIFTIQKYNRLILPSGGGLGYSYLNSHAINDVSISVVLFTTFVDFMKPPTLLEGFFFIENGVVGRGDGSLCVYEWRALELLRGANFL